MIFFCLVDRVCGLDFERVGCADSKKELVDVIDIMTSDQSKLVRGMYKNF